VLNTQLLRCRQIIMGNDYDEKNNEFLSLSPPIVPWHQITSFSIIQPFNSTHLHRVISQMTNLRILELIYKDTDEIEIDWKGETFVDVLNDASLCNMLMSNGLRQLTLSTIDAWGEINWETNWIDIGTLIVERLYHLQIIELRGFRDHLIQLAHILINGLSKLNFLTYVGSLGEGKIYEKKLHDLQNSNSRSFRTEVPNTTDYSTVFVRL
jgi:hypothetical protein